MLAVNINPFLKSGVSGWRLSKSNKQRIAAKGQDISNYFLEPGDILIARSGSIGRSYLFSDPAEKWVFASYLIRFRLIQDIVKPEYLAFCLRSSLFRNYVNRTGRSVAQPNINSKELSRFKFPLPPLSEQQRIASILRQADELRKLRRETLDQAQGLVSALFLEMFGDPILNSKNWEQKTLGKVCEVVGGGTPSKGQSEFWNGDIPWVSPKDMTSNFITSTEDHISALGVENSATKLIPAGAVLVVTRSGILKHTFPCAVNLVEVAINQDMKAFIPQQGLNAVFLLYQLIVKSPSILKT